MSDNYDVIVIGGGPCGSTAASMLAKNDRRVLVLEKSRFPRHHIGESTLLSIHSCLRWIGVEEKVAAAGFRKKTGGTYIWGMDRVPWSFHFSELSELESEWTRPYSYEIDRDVFDQILLDHAEECGAEVMQEVLVRELIQDNGSVKGVVIEQNGERSEIRSSIVIDASGQSSVVGHLLGWRQMNPRLRNAALYGYWSGGPPAYEKLGGDLTPADHSNIIVCSTDFGWIWVIPLRGDRVSIGAVLAGGSDRPRNYPLKETYLQLIKGNEDLAPCISDFRFIEDEPVRSISDWSYCCKQFTLPGLFLAGDAACFIDPILSSGLHLALRAGISVACAANSVLVGQDENLIRHWYESTYLATYRNFEQMALWWYHGDRNRETWFNISQNLIDPNQFGQDLAPRDSFIKLVSGYHTPYVEEEMEGWPTPVRLVSLFHQNASFTAALPRLREKFGVTQGAGLRVDSQPAAHTSAAPDGVQEIVPGLPQIRQEVKFAVEPDPQRLRVSVNAYVPSEEGEPRKLDLTSLAPILIRLDGTRSLDQIGSALGLYDADCENLHLFALELQRQGVLEGVGSE